MPHDFQSDIDAASRISSLSTILEVICRTTGMGFAALARVTEDRWVACSVHDEIDFGLNPGGELKIETTICNEIRKSETAVVIDDVSEEEIWACHPTPLMYGFRSYISVPVKTSDGSFFGTLCAIDPRPARVNTPEIRGMFSLFAELIGKHLDEARKLLISDTERRHWKGLLLQVPAAIALLRGDAHVVEWVNDEFSKLVGRSAANLFGRSLREVLPEVREQQLVANLDSVFQTGTPCRGSEALLRLGATSGTQKELYVNFVYAPMKNDSGEVDGVFAHITDVTSAVVARKRIEQSEERFRQLADSMPQIVWTASADGVPDYHNARWFSFASNDRILKQDGSWMSLLHHADERRVLDTWTECVNSGEPFQMEARLRDYYRGGWRWFMCRAVRVNDSTGTTKWFGTCTDIDEQKASQEALLQTQKLESIGMLAGGIAHDFNNLLVGILGGASFARGMISRSHPAQGILDNVIEASERAADLTRQILAYAGKGRMVVERVNLTELVQQTSHLMGTGLLKSARLTLELAENLPVVESDKGQLQQILMNLILNAAEAVGPENGQIIVRTREEKVLPFHTRRNTEGNPVTPGLYAVLEVQDFGSGIDAAILPQIFDPFFTTKFTGRGLGLAAVAGVVRAHLGSVEVESEVGRGSTFRVLFPAAEAAAAVPRENVPGSSLTGGETVLLVDDEEIVRRVGRAVLELSGYRVLVASGGVEALEQIQANADIALVLLDMSMQGMGGREVLTRLRATHPRLPVVITSGYGEDQVVSEFAGLDIAGVLLKPFTTKVLAEKLRAILSTQPHQTPGYADAMGQ